jgi:small subunit ribosomal protein S18
MIKRTDRTRKPGKCPFCEQKIEPQFSDPSNLRGFLTDRGKIVSRSRSGVCLKHQRHLTQAVKRARFMALLPYVSLAH